MSETELKFRTQLWLNHGCGISVLYGVDGEMQCPTCELDFKREDISKLCDKLSDFGKGKHVLDCLKSFGFGGMI